MALILPLTLALVFAMGPTIHLPGVTDSVTPPPSGNGLESTQNQRTALRQRQIMRGS